jgi:hypothetical protein
LMLVLAMQFSRSPTSAPPRRHVRRNDKRPALRPALPMTYC